MIVCERNNGIRRAETMLPRKPTMSSTIPAMNVGVRAAWIVERSVGAPVAVTSVRCAWPQPQRRTARAVGLQNRRSSVADARQGGRHQTDQHHPFPSPSSRVGLRRISATPTQSVAGRLNIAAGGQQPHVRLSVVITVTTWRGVARLTRPLHVAAPGTGCVVAARIYHR